MGSWALLGGIGSMAMGVVQLCAGDWRGALWSFGGLALLFLKRYWR